MEIIFNARELEKAVSSVIAAVPSRHVVEAQTGILIDATDGSVSFSANNYDMAIRYNIAAQVLQPGKALVSGKLFAELVKRLPGPDITVKEDLERKSVVVKCSAANYRILTMDVHDFLPIDQAEQKNSVDLNAAILRDIYHLTAFAVGDSTTKPEFSGVNISFKNGTLAATATNSHRLARKQIPFEAYPSDFIIPPTAMAVISRLIDTEEKVRLAWSPGKAWIEANNVYISSRLIDGRFPDADRVIPKTFATTVCVDRKQFLQAIERLALVGLQKIEKFTVFTLKLSIVDGLLTLSSEAADKGQAKEELPTITTGEPMDICFSGGYLTDCLEVLTADKVVLSLKGQHAPATITIEDDESYVYVVTPVRMAG